MKRLRLLPWLVVALMAALVAASAGSARTDSAATAAAPAKADQGTYRVALVTDTGGLNDRGFNQLANQGLQRAIRQLGVFGRVFISRTNQDYVPNMSAAARNGCQGQPCDLVIANGFLMADALKTVTQAFPNTKFAWIDGSYRDGGGRTNLRGLLFREQETGYLVGYLAGLTIKRRPVGGQRIVGAVGGIKIPPVDRFIAGYRAGALRAGAGRVLINYSQDFNDQAKCKEQALNQIANGAGIIFQVAGGCGLGALDAARERRLWGIGVDADQSFLGAHILTSALKKVDVAVYNTIAAGRASRDNFRGGFDAVFSVKNNGVGLGKVSRRVPRTDLTAVQRIQRQIAAGRIRIPSTV